MDGAAIGQWATTAIIGLGLIATWARNGRTKAKDLGSLETEVQNIHKILNDSNHGLSALKDEISAFQTHCARVSTGLAEKVAGHDKAIDELKEKATRRGKPD